MTMISDVLFDAIEEIRRYQRDFAGVYDGLENEIEHVVTTMKELQHKLDDPRGGGGVLNEERTEAKPTNQLDAEITLLKKRDAEGYTRHIYISVNPKNEVVWHYQFMGFGDRSFSPKDVTNILISVVGYLCEDHSIDPETGQDQDME